MPEQGEAPQQFSPEGQKSEPRPEDIATWKETIQNQAKSLLGKYLPSALPQEPTVLIDKSGDYHEGQYIGKFNGKHYLNVSHSASRAIKAKETTEELDADDEFLKEIDEFLAKTYPKATNELSPNLTEVDLEWAKLKNGPGHYSFYTWSDIETTVHEMIHQRQAELNPNAFSLLNFNPEETEVQNSSGSIEDHDKQPKIPNTGLNWAIAEGAATVGSYYVMAELEKELAFSGQKEIADRIRRARRSHMHTAMHPMKDILLGPETDWKIKYKGTLIPYDQNYIDGVHMIKTLYKKLGLEETIKFLQGVDLAACQNITRGTSQFQEFIDNPTTLPSLNTATT